MNTARYSVNDSVVAPVSVTTPPCDNSTRITAPANTRLLTGPANATRAKSRRGARKFRISTGTGFAHPISGRPDNMPTSGNNTVPIQSICASGFSVSRPNCRAVESPRRSAAHACAAS